MDASASSSSSDDDRRKKREKKKRKRERKARKKEKKQRKRAKKAAKRQASDDDDDDDEYEGWAAVDAAQRSRANDADAAWRDKLFGACAEDGDAEDPFGSGWGDAERDAYNRSMRAQFEWVRDFVILHYHLNERPEPLWREAREMTIPDSLAERIALFRNRGRVFRQEDELFAEASWIAVLLGQGCTPGGWDPLADALDLEQLRTMLGRVAGTFARAVEGMPEHGAYLSRHCPAVRVEIQGAA